MYKKKKYQRRIVECRLLSTVLRIWEFVVFYSSLKLQISLYIQMKLFYNVLTFKFELIIQVFTNRKEPKIFSNETKQNVCGKLKKLCHCRKRYE